MSEIMFHSVGGVAYRYDVTKNRQLPGSYTLGATSNIRRLATSNDLTKLAVVGVNSPTCKVFNVTSGSEIAMVGVPNYGANGGEAVEFSPDDSLLVFGGRGTPGLTVLDVAAASTKFTVTQDNTYAAGFNHDGSEVYLGATSAPYLRRFSTVDGTELTCPNPVAGVKRLRCDRSGRFLAMSLTSGTTSVRVMRLPDYTTVFSSSQFSVVDLSFSDDGEYLSIVRTVSPFLEVRKTSDWSLVTVDTSTLTSNVNSVAFTKAGDLCVVSGSTTLVAFDTRTWTPVSKVSNRLFGATATAIAAPPPRIITGNVRNIDGDLVQRKVRAHQRDTGELCAETLSDPVTGEYALTLYGGDIEYDIQFMALDTENLNDLFYARVTSGTP